MAPVVLTTKSLLLYSAAPWLVSGVALGYMGKHFGTKVKSNLAKVKRQKQEIQQLRVLHEEQEDQISKLQAKLAETGTDKTAGVEQTAARTSKHPVGHNKVTFLRNLLKANVRLRENIQNEASAVKPAVRKANEK